MQRRTPKSKVRVETVDIMNIKDGVYISEQSYGTVREMKENANSLYSQREFVYRGKLHNGTVSFIMGEDLAVKAPKGENFNHGYTLEGDAKDIFQVEDALIKYNPYEKRLFCYINKDSKLKFVGDPTKSYDIYIRIFSENGIDDLRWVVIYAEASK